MIINLSKLSLPREINQYVPFKVSFTLTVIVFAVSTVPHFIYMHAYPRFQLAGRIFSHSLKSSHKKTGIITMLQLPAEQIKDPTAVEEKLLKQFHLAPLQQPSSQKCFMCYLEHQIHLQTKKTPMVNSTHAGI